MLYVCDGCWIFCLYCEAWRRRCSFKGSVAFRHADVVCLCASCGSSQYCILHELQFVNAGQ